MSLVDVITISYHVPVERFVVQFSSPTAAPLRDPYTWSLPAASTLNHRKFVVVPVKLMVWFRASRFMEKCRLKGWLASHTFNQVVARL